MVSENFYLNVPKLSESFENLETLTKNRKPERIFLMSSNASRLVMAIKQGFCVIPVTPFKSFNFDDFELNIAENYLIKLKYFKECKHKNCKDF